jgi:hypothetical protein
LFYAAGITVAAEPVTYEAGDCIFNLYDYELTTPIKNAVLFGVAKILDTYKNTFGFPYPDDFKVKVTIISSKEEFLDYQKKRVGEVISQTGYYSGAERETVVWKNTDTKEMLAVLFHESSHMILGYRIPWSPMWLNEGLAEYFEGLNVVGEKKRVNLQEDRHEWTKLWAEKGFPMEIDKYINLTYDQWQEFFKKEPNASYTIGYSLVYYMMSNSRTQQLLKRALWQIRMFGPEADSVQTIEDYYPGGFERFEKHWRQWIPRARKYRALQALKDKTKKPAQKTAADKK